MARNGYSREDVQTHYEQGSRGSLPAVNVKVYRSYRDAWQAFQKAEAPDPRFTLEWVEEHVTDAQADAIFWQCCASELEYLIDYATTAEDAIFPAKVYGTLRMEQQGRSGGWLAVDGLPDLENWDAVLLARWRKFERIAREIADDVPFQMLSSIYLNEFEAWADEQEDASAENSEVPVDLADMGEFVNGVRDGN